MSNVIRVIFALALSVFLVGVYRKYSTPRATAIAGEHGNARVATPVAPATPSVATATPPPSPPSLPPPSSPPPSIPEPLLAVKKAAEQVIVSLPEERDSFFVFDENDKAQRQALADIKRKVEEYSQSPAYLRALRTVSESDKAVMRQLCPDSNVRPSMLINMLLVELAGRAARGQQLDAPGSAAEVLKDLEWHRNRVGMQQPNSCLLVVAQFKFGRDRAKATRLAEQRQNVDPFDQRTVWYLHEHGGLDSGAYDLVISFIAAGVIARGPKSFSIDAEPLRFENSKCD